MDQLDKLVEREFRNSPGFPGVWQDAGVRTMVVDGMAES